MTDEYGLNLEFLRTLSLLYVEDDDAVRDALTQFLGRRFPKLEVAANGQQGLDLFKAHNHDVIVTDVRMPVMDGLEMARSIKSICQEVPVIVVTAYNETDYFMRAIEIGVDRYVKKPVNPRDLVAAIYKSTQVRFQQRELERAREHLLNTLEDTVGALARAIEKRDPYTDGHQRRVAELAEAIAREMSLPMQTIQGIRLGGMIHDIGKLNVPAELLSRPGILEPVQFELIKTHCRTGFEIIGDVDFPWPIGEMILQHHERMDGSGYPNGLRGDEILLEARIIAVSDVVEAIYSDRPYRAALGMQRALEEIKTHRGTLYDPVVVDHCIRVLESPTRTLWTQAAI